LGAFWEQGLVAYNALQGLDGEGLALDGARTTAPLGGAKVGKHPTDRGTSGPKRSLRTDGSGMPSGLAVAGAHRHDGPRTRETIESLAVERPAPTPDAPQGLCLDKGYD
jgi:putative transposase